MTIFNYVILFSILFSFQTFAQDTASETSEIKVETESVEPPKKESSQTNEMSKGRIEKLEVTGSYIRRTDVEGPSPVVVIDRTAIEASGFNNVGQLLRADTSSPFGGDGAFVNLRGLGTDRTLVLVNGQRAPKNASSYYAQGSDVNIVPLAAVERIEILKDGASATYGSEAIGGVVNIITRKDMDGIIFTTKYDMSEPIGSDAVRSSIAYASNTNRGSFLASLQHVYTQGIRISSYDYRKGTLRRSSYAPNFEVPPADLKAAPNCPASQISPSSGACIKDLGPLAGSLEGHEFGGILNYTYDLKSDTQFYTTFISRYKQSNSFNPGSSLQVPGGSPGMPFIGADATAISGSPVVSQLDPADYTPGDDITIYGNLPNNLKTKGEEYLGGLIVGTKGYWGTSDWSWDASLNNQFYVDHQRRQGIGLYQETKSALINGSYNQFSNTQQNIDGLTIDAVSRNRSQVSWANFVSAGELGDAIGANWSSAIGVSAAHFDYRENSDDRAINKTLMGLVGADAKGERQLYAGFAEVSGLFANKLEAQLALRFDQYSDFGNTLNPKFALRYQPLKSLTFRSSVGTGFNAPSLQQAYGPQLEFFLNNVYDPVGCNAVGNDQNNDNCKALSISGQQSANRKLKQETSINFNFGMIVEPIKYLTMSLDYWRVQIDNVIISGDTQKLLELESQGVDISKYNATTVRNATTQRLERITFGLSNAGKREVDGLDGNIGYLLKTNAGDFNVGNSFSYLFSFTEAFYTEYGNEQVLGQGGIPRWRNVASLGYSKSWFSSQIMARTTSTVERESRNLAKIPQFTQYDLNFDFSISKISHVSLGAINVFDQRPKLDPSNSSYINSDLYRPVRITYLSYRTEF